MNTQANSQDLYNNANLWADYDEADEIKKKGVFVKKFLPPNITTIIDIGCGNGIITNELSKLYFTVGLDSSHSALSYVKKNKIQAGCDQVPVKNNTFDLFFSSELLEHLEFKTLLNTVSELKRLTKKYILITVPNNENLLKRRIKCPKCNYIFHPDHHLNSFNEKKIVDLIGPDFRHLNTGYFGPLDRNYNRVLLFIKQYVAKQWWYFGRTHIMCSKCKNTQFKFQTGNIISKLTNGLNRVLSRKKPYWMFILFEEKRIKD